MKLIRIFPFEAAVWTLGLVGLFLIDPANASHFTICPLANLGFDFCPGCGLGRSIHWIMHGHIRESFNTHPLGILAVIVLTLRIIQLLKNYRKLYGSNY